MFKYEINLLKVVLDLYPCEPSIYSIQVIIKCNTIEITGGQPHAAWDRTSYLGQVWLHHLKHSLLYAAALLMF